jgi:lauroyl/myristoyl acyltransferase
LRGRTFFWRLRFCFFWLITYLYYWLSKRDKKIKENYRLITRIEDEKVLKKVVKRNVSTLALNWADVFGADRGNPDWVKASTSHAEDAIRNYSLGEKVIIVSPHIGPINALFAAAKAFNVKAWIAVEPIPVHEKLVSFLRARYGDIEFEPVKKGNTMKRAEEKLAEGRIIVLAIDVLNQNGVKVQLGQATGRFPVGAVRLALKSEAKLYLAFPSFGDNRRESLYFKGPMPLSVTGNLNNDTELNIKALISIYEPFFLSHLEDWWRLGWSNLE